MNIWSGSKEHSGLAAALTNPTRLAKKKGMLQGDYPVKVGERTFEDAEQAYQTLKRELPHHAELPELERLMTKVLALKLTQHPRLVEAMKTKGGATWLSQARHVVRGGRWEGEGLKSPFIRSLVAAFKQVAT